MTANAVHETSPHPVDVLEDVIKPDTEEAKAVFDELRAYCDELVEPEQ